MKGHARDLMRSPVVSVGPEAPLAEIASAFAAGGFGGVPVVDPAQAVIGFVSELDLMAALLHNRPLDTPARALMTSPLVSVDEFDRTEEVIRVLREQRIHHLPVLRAGQLVGIITPSDVIRFVVRDVAPPPKEAG
jgi:CBS domain-containing protein